MISISILNIKDDEEKIKMIDNLNTDFIHIDVMDGLFVSNKVDFLSLPNVNTKVDVHLMVYDVKKYIDYYKKYNPEYITFHLEASSDINTLINYVKSLNIKVGLSIKPNTQLDYLKPYLDKVDLVLVMSVNPGMGGQSFLMSTIDRLKIIHKDSLENKFLVSVDGGINAETLKYVKPYVNIIVSGYYICKEDNYQMQIDKLKY